MENENFIYISVITLLFFLENERIIIKRIKRILLKLIRKITNT